MVIALLLILAASPAFSPMPKPGVEAPALSAKDIKERSVSVPDPGHVQVVSFGSKSTGEKAGEITRAVRVKHPEIEVLSFIDLSGFPGLLQGTVRKKILAKHPVAVKEASEAFVKAGKTPPEDLDARIHMIPDFDQTFCKAYGASDTGRQAQIVVIGADGKVKAVFEKTPKAEDVISAVARELGKE